MEWMGNILNYQTLVDWVLVLSIQISERGKMVFFLWHFAVFSL
jgi:hypothetical protein